MKFIALVFMGFSFVFGNCYAPSFPICLQYPDNYSGSSCRISVNSYLDDLINYRKCIVDDTNNVLNSIDENYNNTVKAYNCIYGGNC